MLQTYEDRVEKIKDDLEIRSYSKPYQKEYIKHQVLCKLDDLKKKKKILEMQS